MNKFTNLRLMTLITVVLFTDVSNIYAVGNNISDKVNLQQVLDNAVAGKDKNGAYLSGIPLVFQCRNFNQRVTLTSGKISTNVDAQDLPIDGIFQAGSITKSLVAVVALQLEAESYFGVNGLDSTIGEVLQATPLYWNLYWNKITLRQLLNMTSGISDSNPTDSDNIILKYIKNPYQYITTDELIASIATKELLFEPGHGWHYADSNYIILNKIITQITGVSLKKHIIERIIRPLSLTHTYYVENLPQNEVAANQKDLLISGYVDMTQTEYQSKYIYPKADIKPYSLSWVNAAGALLTDIQDLNTYARALFRSGELLTQHQIKELTYLVAEQNDSKYKAGEHVAILDGETTKAYGMGIEGLSVPTSDGKNALVYEHGGATMGFVAEWLYQPDRQASIASSVNGTDQASRGILGEVVDKALSKVFNECAIAN